MTQLALLGSPVHSALSPLLHRAAYATLGLPWTSIHRLLPRRPGTVPHLAERQLGRYLPDPAAETHRHTAPGRGLRDRRRNRNGEHHRRHRRRTPGRREHRPARHAPGPGRHRSHPCANRHRAGRRRHRLHRPGRGPSPGCHQVLALARHPSRAGSLRQAAARLGITLTVRPWPSTPDNLTADIVISTVPPGAADTSASQWPRGPGTLLDVTYNPWPSPLATAR